MAEIEITSGDMFKADAEALVNTVNCVGIMGRGIALQFKKLFPRNFREYQIACDAGEVQPGRMFVHDTGQFTNPRYIINFPTKRHWKGKSKIEDIDAGLIALAKEIEARDIRSIAIPPLGSGLGGLKWSDVRPRIETALRNVPNVKVVVFEPKGAPEVVKSREVPNMTAGRAALVVLMNRYLRGLMDPFVTLIEVQKLMYFMQEAGQPLKLNYVKAPYGPFAGNLSHVLHRIEGHFLSGYSDGGDAPDKELTLVPGAIDDAEGFLSDDEETRNRFDQVGELVEGFETPFGLELLATVHWVTKHEGASNADDAVARVHSWNDRKRQFTPRQIGLAYNVLQSKGWLAAA